MCLYQDTLKTVVASHEGWNYTNEGTEAKPKQGFVTWEPGKPLTSGVDTPRPHAPSGGSGGLVPVFIAYMRSYVNMGKALYECASGCSCEARTYDGHHVVRVSQLYLAELHVSQHAACTISITVQAETSSGKHKYKVRPAPCVQAADE